MFMTAMFLEVLEKIRDRAYQNSKNKGFWDGPDNCNIPTKLCLIHAELSEWLEAHRKDPTAPCGKTETVPIGDGQVRPLMMVGQGGESRPLTCEEEEAADVFIRLLDLCGFRGIDLGQATLTKMRYNEARPYLHGKRC